MDTGVSLGGKWKISDCMVQEVTIEERTTSHNSGINNCKAAKSELLRLAALSDNSVTIFV